jgi:hypothetical protein
MAGVPDVGLLAAPIGVGAMGKTLFVGHVPIGPIVAGHDQERVTGEAGLIERLQNAAEGIVDLGHEIAIISGLGSAAELGSRQPGRVGCGERKVEEEGLCGWVARRSACGVGTADFGL